MATICNRCQQQIKWPQPYQQGQKPLNMDGSIHQCAGKPPNSGNGSPPSNVQVQATLTDEEASQLIDRVWNMTLIKAQSWTEADAKEDEKTFTLALHFFDAAMKKVSK